MGDTLWTHTYQKYPAKWAQINTVTPLSGGRILVGAQSVCIVYLYWNTIFEGSYYHSSPWFMVLDNMGNVLRDTIYGNRTGSAYYEGNLYPAYMAGNTGGNKYMATLNMDTDINGGYYFTGEIDTVIDSEGTDDPREFTDFLAHLDTNFNIVWITRFNWTGHYGHRYISKIRQLPDSSYLVIGSTEDADTLADGYGWAAKVSRNGTILWNHDYRSDPGDTTSVLTTSAGYSYFRDGAVRPDGSLVFVGAGFDDTLPTWRQGQDVWLVGTDSNGCQQPGGCDPDTSNGAVVTEVATPPGLPATGAEEVFRVWPNPTSGSFTVMVSSVNDEWATIVITNMVGQRVKEFTGMTNTDIDVQLSQPAGVYFISVTTAEGVVSGKVVVSE